MAQLPPDMRSLAAADQAFLTGLGSDGISHTKSSSYLIPEARQAREECNRRWVPDLEWGL